MKLEIKKTNDPILRKATEVVTDFDMELQKLIDDMVETMRHANGVGLAAPQVGTSKKIITIEYCPDKEEPRGSAIPLVALCNPKVTKHSQEEIKMVEGCLSFPGIEILVKRPKKVTVEGQDRYGKKIKIDADGLFARVLQHEIDHLNSTLLPDHIQQSNVIFIGTGTLGVPALQMLASDPQYKIKMVITSSSEAKSRNHQNIKNPIEETAKLHKLPIVKTKNINSPAIIEQIKKIKPDLGVMADFGQIVKKDILEIPKFGIINIHPSILPKHRGPSPVQQTILNGDKYAGVTLILTSPKMDAGDIISQVQVELAGSETSTILKNYLAEVGGSLLLNSLPYYLAGDLKPDPQDDNPTYTYMFKKEDGFVDENAKEIDVERKIRAFDTWPKVFTILNNKRVQILASHFDAEGNLVIDRVKPEGKKEMSYNDFVRGYKTKLTFKR